jgi:hypothetical protein
VLASAQTTSQGDTSSWARRSRSGGRCFRYSTSLAWPTSPGGSARPVVELVSTGGTHKLIRDADLPVREISDLTGFPEMMDGRVKTLHPKVHGGLLAVRDNAEHAASMDEHQIGAIDLVAVNLYPFRSDRRIGRRL